MSRNIRAISGFQSTVFCGEWKGFPRSFSVLDECRFGTQYPLSTAALLVRSSPYINIKDFVKTQPPQRDQNSVVMRTSKHENSAHMLQRLSGIAQPKNPLPTRYFRHFQTLYLPSRLRLPEGRADSAWKP